MTHPAPPAPVLPLPQAAPAPAEDERAPHILLARYRKARKVATALVQHGANAESTAALGQTELGRKLAAQAAGSHVPSEVTWALVVELVREVRP